jgi:hypothetical protein
MFCDVVTKEEDCRIAPQGINRIEEMFLAAIKKRFNIVTVFFSVPGCH